MADRWSAVAGSELVRVLAEWGGRAECAVVVDQDSDWRLDIGFTRDGKFRVALEELLARFATAAFPPVVAFNANGVMTGARR